MVKYICHKLAASLPQIEIFWRFKMECFVPLCRSLSRVLPPSLWSEWFPWGQQKIQEEEHGGQGQRWEVRGECVGGASNSHLLKGWRRVDYNKLYLLFGGHFSSRNTSMTVTGVIGQMRPLWLHQRPIITLLSFAQSSTMSPSVWLAAYNRARPGSTQPNMLFHLVRLN